MTYAVTAMLVVVLSPGIARAQTADRRGSDRSRLWGYAFAGAGRFNEQQTIAVDYENWATD